MKQQIYYMFVFLLCVVPFVVSIQIDYSSEMNLLNTYEYIVVGLGQGGSAAAGRLAYAGKKTLGIEWGNRTHRSLGGKDFSNSAYSFDSNGNVVVDTPYTRFDIPGYFRGISQLIPAPYPGLEAQYNGVNASVLVAKLLGGSGAHNGMVYIRHSKDSINAWNVTGWSYDDLLPFYKRMENYSASANAGNYTEYHGYDGPIQLSDTPNDPYYYSIIPPLLTACLNLSDPTFPRYPHNIDYNGPSRYGCGTQTYSIGRGVRSSAANAYLPKALEFSNFHLKVNAKVIKILIRKPFGCDEPIAYGIQYIEGGVTKRAFATKEIIIAASGIFTPKLLMLSGIGPAADLTRFGIHVWVDNPNVGQQVKNNQFLTGSIYWPNATYGSIFQVATAANEYAFNGTGPFASTGPYVWAYVCSNTSINCTNPDISVAVLTGPIVNGVPTLQTQVENATPHAAGSVRLLSADHNDCVNLTIPLFSDPDDLTAHVFGWKLLRQIFATPPMTSIVGAEIAPGPAYPTDASLTEWVLNNARFTAHWVGATKMGNDGDPTRVTDPQLRVLGIKNLRIGDVSIYPTVNSHAQAPAALVGERVACFILNCNVTA